LRGRDLDYAFADLNERIALDRRFDLAICVEVAEHLRPEHGPSLVDDLCRLSEAVLFGAALPHQPGKGHINCRPHHGMRRTAFDVYHPLLVNPAVLADRRWRLSRLPGELLARST
jgi:hypothetical protein